MIRNASKVVLVALLLIGSKSAFADIHAAVACRPATSTDSTNAGPSGIGNLESSKAVDLWCPLKAVTCAGSCTYNASFTGADNNTTNDADHNVSCQLGFIQNGGAWYTSGSPVSLSNTGTITSASLSYALGATMTGYVAAKCHVAMTGGSNTSYVVEFTSMNF